MQGQINPKIVGATIIGFALVGGAYTISSLKTPRTPSQPAALGATAPERVAIVVTDEDNNGIEDWQDDFVTTDPLILKTVSSSTYEQPTSITGQMSIHFFEDIVRAKKYGPFGKTEEEVIQRTVGSIADQTSIELYDTPDIDIMEIWDEQDVRNYANTIVATMIQNNTPGDKSEIELLYALVVENDKTKISEMQAIATTYEAYRDDTLKIPVPTFLVKEHLDLINTYHTIYTDITAMIGAKDDPVLALARLKRYQDDASGLGLALNNLYETLKPYSHLIERDDPAALFVVFSPDFQQ